MKKLLLASTSTLHGQQYLEYLSPVIKDFFSECSWVLFVPYARPGGISHQEYTRKASEAFKEINIRIRGIEEFPDPIEAVRKAEAIFTGGGNTFLLVKELYRNGLIPEMTSVIEKGVPYMGTSAGTNITGISMKTTNDMPIVYPPDFNTLGLVPFNLNCHYLDPDPESTHKGETRETRIREFHKFNAQPVIGLREGSWLEVYGTEITLKGGQSARIFKADELPFEAEDNSILNDLK